MNIIRVRDVGDNKVIVPTFTAWSDLGICLWWTLLQTLDRANVVKPFRSTHVAPATAVRLKHVSGASRGHTILSEL